MSTSPKYTRSSLVDIHARVHQTWAKLVEHCGQFSEAELTREIPGFGYGTIRSQIHHAVAAERYWVGVLEGRMDVDEDEHLFPDGAALEKFRKDIFAMTQGYLERRSDDELSQSQRVITWGDQERLLVPALVVLRTQTHYFHHQGQILAMSRLLERPANGFDFVIT